jgi:uncharacterized protein with FMN-binding domain
VRRALPAVVLTAGGLTWLLRVQGVINAGLGGPAVVATDAGATDAGAVSGDPVTTPYGIVQVAALVRGGRLEDVRVLQAPSTDANSQRITGQATPQLRDEALAAQSARIDSVAGATYTSDGYRRSLQSAIDAARQRDGTPVPDPTAVPAPSGPAATAAPAPTPAPTTTTAPRPAPGPSTTAAPANRTVDGPVVTHRFGPVQVQATISGGRLTDVKTLQFPRENATSTAINNGALPKLRQRALTTQGARGVATVSGATLTSDAFRQSLQAALDMAGFRG